MSGDRRRIGVATDASVQATIKNLVYTIEAAPPAFRRLRSSPQRARQRTLAGGICQRSEQRGSRGRTPQTMSTECRCRRRTIATMTISQCLMELFINQRMGQRECVSLSGGWVNWRRTITPRSDLGPKGTGVRIEGGSII